MRDAAPVDAAVAVSRRRFTAGGQDTTATHRRAAHVVLSRDDTSPDSLAGSPLSATGPLLFTSTASLPAATAAEVCRVLPAGGTVYLLGGDTAISPVVAAQITALSSPVYRTVRLSGPSRVETSLRIADEVRRLYPGNNDVLVARAYGAAGNESSGWADSVTGGAYGARARNPVVLTPTNSLHPAVREWTARNSPSRSIVLGGTGAISETVRAALPRDARVAGAERTATAAAVATQLWRARTSGPRRW